MRVLIVAENASTRFGGEAILPFHYFRLLRARAIDAHLIVHARTREELLTHFPHDLNHLHFAEDQLLQKVFYRIGKLLPHRINEATFGLANQLLTQSAQRKILRKLVIPGTVVHQPIPVSPRFPSLMYSLGAPVVIGPLNGGMTYPPAFRSSESPLSRATIALGRSFTNLFNTIFPGKRQAAVLLVANQRTREALPANLTGQIHEIPENAVDTALWTAQETANSATNFLFIGRLVDWKALDIAIEALARIPTASLDVIGDGPMRPAWQSLAASLNLAGRIRFHGWLSQSECATRLANSAGLLLPSLYECGGAVVLEAMAMSRPVIATAWGGPADYLDPTCGILIPPTSREALIDGFANAMESLAATPSTGQTMGTAGRQKLLLHFDWQPKINRILDIYTSALL